MAVIPLSDAPDSVLVERAVDGDARAFESLIRRHAGLMRAYAIRLTGARDDADDVVQEAFITAWSQLDRLQDPAAVRSWLMRIVSRKAIDRIRSRRPEAELDAAWSASAPAAEEPEQQAVVRSQMEAVSHILSSLPELQRQCWMLKEVGGYSYQEIADEFELPLSTVRGALARARQALLRGMGEWT